MKLEITAVREALTGIRVESEVPRLERAGLVGSAAIARKTIAPQLAEKQLWYLVHLLKNPAGLALSTKRFVQKQVRTRAKNLANVYFGARQPSGAFNAYAEAKLYRKGAKHLFANGYAFHAAELYRLGNSHFYGATQLAKTSPEHAAELFKEAKKPLKGARILIKYRSAKSMHAFHACELFKEANAHREGIKAMQRIGRSDLVDELRRHEEHAAGDKEYRRITGDFLAARASRLTGKKPSGGDNIL